MPNSYFKTEINMKYAVGIASSNPAAVIKFDFEIDFFIYFLFKRVVLRLVIRIPFFLIFQSGAYILSKE